MNPTFAAGLFDQPWVVAVVIIVGAVINWLSQRRQKKQSGEHPPGEEASAAPGNAQGEFDLEETLRRLLGEQAPPTSPVPPPVPRAIQGERPPPVRPGASPAQPIRTWVEDVTDGRKPTVPVLQPPPLAVARPVGASLAVPQTSEQAAVRFEQLNDQGRHPARALDLRPRQRSGVGARTANWRDRASVRRAFVASLVFAPPKGLEP
jgi:hypothetical protein